MECIESDFHSVYQYCSVDPVIIAVHSSSVLIPFQKTELFFFVKLVTGALLQFLRKKILILSFSNTTRVLLTGSSKWGYGSWTLFISFFRFYLSANILFTIRPKFSVFLANCALFLLHTLYLPMGLQDLNRSIMWSWMTGV